MNHPRRLVFVTMVFSIGVALPVFAQDDGRVYAGALVGVSTLSADARSVTAAPRADVSLYKPENGPALNAFAGVHLGRFFTVQANYVWNRNDVMLLSSFVSPEGGGFYEQNRRSAQHAIVGDALLYFRALGNRVRPYLSTGVGLVRFDTGPASRSVASGLTPPEGGIASTRVAMRVAVGMDLATTREWSFRYSFSETISGNPISERLMPAGQRNFANFQNLFGFVRQF